MRMFSGCYALFMAFVGLPGLADPTPQNSSGKRAAPVVVIPAEAPDRVPVVVELMDAGPGMQALIEVKPAPAWQADLPPVVTKKDGKYDVRERVGTHFTGPPGKYRVEVLYVDFDARQFGKKVADVVIVGKGPKPPPDDPDDPPPDEPDAAKLPFPKDGFYCLFLHQDTDHNLYTPVQRAAMYGEAAAVYLNEKATKGPEGQPMWKAYDVDQQFIGEGVWKEAHKRALADLKAWEAKNPGKKTPWVLVGNGTKGFSGPLPADSLDAALALFRTYGG